MTSTPAQNTAFLQAFVTWLATMPTTGAGATAFLTALQAFVAENVTTPPPPPPPSPPPPPPPTAWPSAATTGYGSTSLTAGSPTLVAGQTYSGIKFSTGFAINVNNVTIENCLIQMTPTDTAAIKIGAAVTGTVIKNTEIAGAGLKATQGGCYGVYVMNGAGTVMISTANIHDVGTGIVVSGGQTSIQASFIHDLNSGPGTHYNGVMYNGSGTAASGLFSLSLQGNAIINQNTQTDAVMLDNYFGSCNGVTVSGNLLKGGDYPIYVDGSQGSTPITGIAITNNSLGFGNGTFGYADINKGSLSAANFQISWSGNVDATTGAAIPLP